MRHGASRVLGALAASLLLGVASAAPAPSREQVGMFEGQSDIGPTAKRGSAAFDSGRQEYTVDGAGSEARPGGDGLHFVWRRMKGDFILTARARPAGSGRAGWAVRSGLEPGAPHAAAAVGGGPASLQFRRGREAGVEEVRSPVEGADVVQLERKGDTFTMSVARFGAPFAAEQVSGLALGDEVYVGLFASRARAVFDNVRVTVPAKSDFVPYRDYIGSLLEILEVDTGERRVVHTSLESLQAPNWTPDGRALIYNHNGRLFRFDLARRVAAAIDTGFATANNNDHVLSFDGKMLGISHHSQEDAGESIVYVLPVEGGTPRRVTLKGPSYLHGWSPDGKQLVYTGGRDGEFDIYKISVDGGEEVRLTDAKGLDDGSEYSPDGRYIYFNSSRTGRMQIWRMRPDGSGQEQVTDDEYNNWFPHLSPDGTRILFLSYSREVDAADHPFYKQVYLRMMPAAGGPAKVVAYLYGGQGTINVPSWSPDGTRVAFVSNTDLR